MLKVNDKIECQDVADMLKTSLELQNSGYQTKFDFSVWRKTYYVVITEVPSETDRGNTEESKS